MRVTQKIVVGSITINSVQNSSIVQIGSSGMMQSQSESYQPAGNGGGMPNSTVPPLQPQQNTPPCPDQPMVPPIAEWGPGEGGLVPPGQLQLPPYGTGPVGPLGPVGGIGVTREEREQEDRDR
jgi:hypothetical protein